MDFVHKGLFLLIYIFIRHILLGNDQICPDFPILYNVYNTETWWRNAYMCLHLVTDPGTSLCTHTLMM